KLTLLCDVHPRTNYVPGAEIFRGAGLFGDFECYQVVGSSASRLLGALQRLKLLFRLRARRFRTLFYLAPSIRTPAQVERDRRFFRAAGIERFYGMDHFPRVPDRNSARPLPAAGHEADLILARLKADGIPVPTAGGGSLELGLGEREEREIDRWLRP